MRALTPLELAVAVSLTGTLAATMIPTFLRNVHASRLSEPVEGLKRIALLSADKSYAVRIGLTENQLLITANNPDLGEAKDALDIAYQGAAITIGFNARYLIDVLGVTDTDEVAFELGDEHSPGVLHAPGDRSFTAVVMPMRV